MNARTKLALAGLLLTVAVVPACADRDAGDGTAAVAAEKDSGSEQVAVYFGEEAVSLGEIDAKLAEDLDRLDKMMVAERYKLEEGAQQQRYALRRNAIDEMVYERLTNLEAEEQGITLEELIQAEVTGKTEPPPDAEVAQVYQQYGSQAPMLQGKSLEEATPIIVPELMRMKETQRRADYLDELKAKHNVRYGLDFPRVDVPIPAGEPSMGPDDAVVTLVEFSDFQCGYCKRAHPMIEQLIEEYGDQIRFVYRDYIVPGHDRALPASVAARCAGEQGKYWEYHRNLMESAGSLADDDLKRRAEEVELDQAAFDACVANEEMKTVVEASVEEAAMLGITGTPTFFINGRKLQGAQPIDLFKKIIEEEIARGGTSENVGG